MVSRFRYDAQCFPICFAMQHVIPINAVPKGLPGLAQWARRNAAFTAVMSSHEVYPFGQSVIAYTLVPFFRLVDQCPDIPVRYRPKPTKRRRELNAARIARYRARLRHGQSVFKVEGNKADIILALRGLAHTAGMNEFMLTPEASHEEIEEKLSMLIGQITDTEIKYRV